MSKPYIILDTDIGTNPDDLLALIMLARHSDALCAVVSGMTFPQKRIQLVSGILKKVSTDTALYEGMSSGNIDLYWNPPQNALKIKTHIKDLAAKIEPTAKYTYVNIQSCTNLAYLIKLGVLHKGNCKIVQMGLQGIGAVHLFDDTNAGADILATKYVLESRIPIKIIGSHVTTHEELRLSPETDLFKRLQKRQNRLDVIVLEQLYAFHQRRGIWPAMHDPLAVSAALELPFVAFESVSIKYVGEGYEWLSSKSSHIMLSTGVDRLGFMAFLTKQISEQVHNQ